MDWQIAVAITIALPIILLPVAVVWYINGVGLYKALGAAFRRRKTDAARPYLGDPG
jgi:hypothetical protein